MSARREQMRPAILLCLLIIVALAVGAVARTPSKSGDSDLLGSATQVIGLSVLGVCVVITIVVLVSQLLTFRRRKDDESVTRVYSPPMSRLARLAMIAATAILVAGVAVLMITVMSNLNSSSETTSTPNVRQNGLPRPAMPQQHQTQADEGSGISLELMVAGIIVVVVLAVIGYVIYRITRPVLGAERAEDEQQQTRVRLAAALDDADRALSAETEPRAAIIACYRSMEFSLNSVGVQRTVADTPEELLSRAVSAGLAVPSAAWQLTDLFREARFSVHPMSGLQREQAAAALAQLREELMVS